MTDVPGSSDYVIGGVITYRDETKTELLSVNAELITKHGAVSEEVAVAMADGVVEKLGADCGVAITGIAGPSGGRPGKPVGTVWIASAIKGHATEAVRLQLMGDRQMIRERAAQAALNHLRVRLLAPQL